MAISVLFVSITSCGTYNSPSPYEDYSNIESIQDHPQLLQEQTNIKCLGKNNSEISINNDQVLNWKKTTANQYTTRGHAKGKIGVIYPNKNGHAHFQVKIGTGNTDTIEGIYNLSFGNLPKLQTGMEVELCGDYITSNASTSQYPASPDGALIHWVHLSCKPKNHPSGFVIIDGKYYGGNASQCH